MNMVKLYYKNYDEQLIKVNIIDRPNYYDGSLRMEIPYIDGEQANGIVKEYYHNGKLASETEYKNFINVPKSYNTKQPIKMDLKLVLDMNTPTMED